jgi:hypothetical protein
MDSSSSAPAVHGPEPRADGQEPGPRSPPLRPRLLLLAPHRLVPTPAGRAPPPPASRSRLGRLGGGFAAAAGLRPTRPLLSAIVPGPGPEAGLWGRAQCAGTREDAGPSPTADAGQVREALGRGVEREPQRPSPWPCPRRASRPGERSPGAGKSSTRGGTRRCRLWTRCLGEGPVGDLGPGLKNLVTNGVWSCWTPF